MRERQFWIYKNNSTANSSGHWGRWKKFFRDSSAKDWSDPGMVTETWGSGVEPERGDLMFAQQSNAPRRIIGMARVVSNGEYLRLKPLDKFPKAVRLPPKKVLMVIDRQVADIRAMLPKRGSLFLLDQAEAESLARFCGPAALALITATDTTRAEEILSEAGAGFGTAAENRNVEQAAIRGAIAWFEGRGWKLRADVQKKCLGYDLVFGQSGKLAHVEVKGVGGSVPAFFLTVNEERCMREDDDWHLCVVTSALLKPKVQVFNSTQGAKHFKLKPALFKVSPRSKSSP